MSFGSEQPENKTKKIDNTNTINLQSSFSKNYSNFHEDLDDIIEKDSFSKNNNDSKIENNIDQNSKNYNLKSQIVKINTIIVTLYFLNNFS